MFNYYYFFPFDPPKYIKIKNKLKEKRTNFCSCIVVVVIIIMMIIVYLLRVLKVLSECIRQSRKKWIDKFSMWFFFFFFRNIFNVKFNLLDDFHSNIVHYTHFSIENLIDILKFTFFLALHFFSFSHRLMTVVPESLPLFFRIKSHDLLQVFFVGFFFVFFFVFKLIFVFLITRFCWKNYTK